MNGGSNTKMTEKKNLSDNDLEHRQTMPVSNYKPIENKHGYRKSQ